MKCDDYVLRLLINDHLRECLLIDDEIKITKNSTTSFSMKVMDLEYNYETQLADLYLLLEGYLDTDIIERRRREKEELDGYSH